MCIRFDGSLVLIRVLVVSMTVRICKFLEKCSWEKSKDFGLS